MRTIWWNFQEKINKWNGLESEAKASRGPKVTSASGCWNLKSIKVKIEKNFYEFWTGISALRYNH